MEWFKNLIEQYYKKGGQSLVNLSIILIIGVIIMIAGSNLLGIGSGKETKSAPAKTEDIQPVNKKQSDCENLFFHYASHIIIYRSFSNVQ